MRPGDLAVWGGVWGSGVWGSGSERPQAALKRIPLFFGPIRWVVLPNFVFWPNDVLFCWPNSVGENNLPLSQGALGPGRLFEGTDQTETSLKPCKAKFSSGVEKSGYERQRMPMFAQKSELVSLWLFGNGSLD